MIIAITGHRPNKLGNDYNLTSPLIMGIKAKLQKIIEESKPTQIITGMALGIDTLWAELAIENNIPFIAAIPCKNQEGKWPQKSKDRYSKIINHPLCIRVYVSDKEYDDKCMQKRNEYMVDTCDLLIAVWDGSPGGTANCVAYASQLKPVYQINPKTII